MKNYLHFRASTNLKNLIGKDLVTDEVTAVFELVKNSYDADANEVKIELYDIKGETQNGRLTISDDGSAMSLEEIESKWMVIGTQSKKNIDFSPKYHRSLNGEKGIGRFSVDRLGSKLKLISTCTRDLEKIVMEFDWTKFENQFDDMENIEIPFDISKTSDEKSGLILEINELRDNWNEKKISKLISNLKQFKSPFGVEDNFKILVNAPEYNIHWLEIQPNKLEDISDLWVETEVSINDLMKVKIKIVRNGVEYNDELINNYKFGPIKTKIYFFNQANKVSFKNRFGTTVKDFGNIRLYRDDFRVYPYGDESDDWLDLDRRKAQGFARFFGSRDLIGYAQIYKRYNKGIEAPTNREGIIENEQAKQLREFIIEYPIKKLEEYYFTKHDKKVFDNAKSNVNTAVEELKKVAKEVQNASPETAKVIRKISEIVRKGQQEQTEFVKNQEEVLNVYKRVASKEILLHQIVHQTLIRVENIKTLTSSQSKKVNKYEKMHIKLVMEQLKDYFGLVEEVANEAKVYLLNVRDHLISKKEKVKLNISQVIKEKLNSFSNNFNENKIEMEYEINDVVEMFIDKDDLVTIIENFISNSIKSLIKVNDRQRKMIIKVIENKKYIILIFKDNGVGIDEGITDRIFDPFYTTTNGFGMGLSIVDEIVKAYNGEVNLVKNYEAGAEFQVKFKR